ncbi:MAG: hypothetical protein U9N57_02490 [Pseudomonadota bacterium]|nr:hypothetical protein [Pseudomonadota bacterium]
MNLLNIQDNKANLHIMRNLVMAQVAMRQLQRDGHTVITVDPNGKRPVIIIEPPLNNNIPLCSYTTIRRGQSLTTGHIYHLKEHIADVMWHEYSTKKQGLNS